MQLVTDLKKLDEIMKSFYTLTGIRFTIFDSDYHEIVAYPRENCRFCELMKKNPLAASRCRASDTRAFASCQKNRQLHVYRCHAGLVEATLPLTENGAILGYVMFGQITNEQSRALFRTHVLESCREYAVPPAELRQAIKEIQYKSPEHILAASRILETCTYYMILKEMIAPKKDRILTEANNYIDEHLSEDIDIHDLCRTLKISRTKLYEIYSANGQEGIGRHIRLKRLEKARQLLKTTDLPIAQIASSVGFADYNYFSRVYKKYYGKSPGTYRK